MLSLLGVTLLLTSCPLMVFYFYVSCTHYHCALSAPLLGILTGDVTLAQFWSQLPPITAAGFKIVLPWVAFQVCNYFGLISVLKTKGRSSPAFRQERSRQVYTIKRITIGWFTQKMNMKCVTVLNHQVTTQKKVC